MIPEKFKDSDAVESKVDASAKPAFDQTGTALDQFFADAYFSGPFLLNLYDDKRIPFAERIKRAAFVEFVKELFNRYPFIGNFETHLFVLRAIFGELSDIYFEVPSPGILNIDVSGTASLEFDFVGEDESGNIFNFVDSEGSQLVFRGISGIETSYELELLFSEILPAGISPHISLSFFDRYQFVAEPNGDDVLFGVIDNLGNDIVFSEIGV